MLLGYKTLPPLKTHSAYDALIYATALLKYYKKNSIFSPDESLAIEILDLSNEEGGVHVVIDSFSPKGKRTTVFSVHWIDDSGPDFIHYEEKLYGWFARLEDWYDRIRSVEEFPDSRTESSTVGPTEPDQAES